MYPTKDEILAEIDQHPLNETTVNTVLKWKEDFYLKRWKKYTQTEKMLALEQLLWALYPGDFPPNLLWTNLWAYQPETGTILGDTRVLSITSMLHEIGHAIHGESELQACVYAVNIFRTCFPKEYGRLTWKGHMLIKA